METRKKKSGKTKKRFRRFKRKTNRRVFKFIIYGKIWRLNWYVFAWWLCDMHRCLSIRINDLYDTRMQTYFPLGMLKNIVFIEELGTGTAMCILQC